MVSIASSRRKRGDGGAGVTDIEVSFEEYEEYLCRPLREADDPRRASGFSNARSPSIEQPRRLG
jgi:hypothetical protein